MPPKIRQRGVSSFLVHFILEELFLKIKFTPIFAEEVAPKIRDANVCEEIKKFCSQVTVSSINCNNTFFLNYLERVHSAVIKISPLIGIFKVGKPATLKSSYILADIKHTSDTLSAMTVTSLSANLNISCGLVGSTSSFKKHTAISSFWVVYLHFWP